MCIGPRRTVVSGSGTKSAIVGKQTSFDLCLERINAFPLNLISCQLCSPTGNTTCIVSHFSTESSKYQVSYTASERGPHQLKVLVGGIEMLDGSITIHVLPSPKMRGQLARCVALPHKPYGLSLTKEGLVVVAMDGGHISMVSSKEEVVRSFKMPSYPNPVGVAVMRDNKHIAVIGTCLNCLIKVNLEGDIVASIGSKGSKILQFSDSLNEIGVHPHTGQVFITDTGNHCVQVLNEDLTFSHTFGKKGKGEGQFLEPVDISFDSEGMVYITDPELGKVQKFTQKGHFMFGFTYTRASSICIDKNDVVYLNSQGYSKVSMYSTSGQFVHSFDIDCNSVCGLKVDHYGNLFISDHLNKHLLVY